MVKIELGDTDWYQNPNEVSEFARVLIGCDKFDSVEQLQSYYEKPWHWTEEYELYKKLGKPREGGGFFTKRIDREPGYITHAPNLEDEIKKVKRRTDKLYDEEDKLHSKFCQWVYRIKTGQKEEVLEDMKSSINEFEIDFVKGKISDAIDWLSD